MVDPVWPPNSLKPWQFPPLQVELGGTAVIECLTAAHPKSLNFWHDREDQFINQRSGEVCTLDKDGSDQSTPAKLVDAGFLVSDQYRDKNMFDFLF